jgi:hypothetical protein
MELVAPFQLVEDYISYTPDWPKPVGWPWDWPIQPDCILDDPQCKFCSTNSYTCIRTRFKSDFTETKTDRKGRGLLAGKPGRGTVVFEKGQPLGRLVGELVAPGTYTNSWGFDLVRSDIMPKRPIVAQIYPRDRGNVFRLVNHACKKYASAEV